MKNAMQLKAAFKKIAFISICENIEMIRSQIISFEQKINLPRNFKLHSKFVEDFCYLLFFVLLKPA